MLPSPPLVFCPLYSEENNLKSEKKKKKTVNCVVEMVELKIYSKYRNII